MEQKHSGQIADLNVKSEAQAVKIDAQAMKIADMNVKSEAQAVKIDAQAMKIDAQAIENTAQALILQTCTSRWRIWPKNRMVANLQILCRLRSCRIS